MTKNYLIRYQRIAIIILVAILLGLFIFYFIFRSKSPPTLTDEEKQAIVDSTTAPVTATPINEKEKQTLIISTTAPTPKTTNIINNKKNLKYNEN
jgi:hypothetical protein